MILQSIFSVNGISNLLQGGFGWLQYNRDNYATNLELRQNQLYQEKNYHISWIAIARDDVRDIMQTSVGRLNNYLIVITLIFSVSATAILEGEVPETAEPFVRTAYLANLTISVVYFVLSIMFCVKGSKEAFHCSLDLLTAELRPDHPDRYDHNYMKQTQEFEKGGFKAGFRIPIVGSKCTSAMRTLGLKDAKPKQEPLEMLPKPKIDQNPCIRDPFDRRASSDVLSDGLQAPVVEPKNTQERDTAWYFARFRAFQDLWQPYEDGARRCMGYGMVALGHASAYYIMGILHDRGQFWVSITLVCMLTYLTMLVFFSSVETVEQDEHENRTSAYSQAVLNRAASTDGYRGAVSVSTLTILSIAVGPLGMVCIATMRLHGLYGIVTRVGIPVCFCAHLILACIAFIRDHRSIQEKDKEIRGMGSLSHTAGEQDQGSDCQASAASLQGNGVARTPAQGCSPPAGPLQGSPKGDTPGDHCIQCRSSKCIQDPMERFCAAHQADVAKLAKIADPDNDPQQQDPQAEARRDDEVDFEKEVERYHKKIAEAFMIASGQSRYAHFVAALMWLSISIESLFSITFASTSAQSNVESPQARYLRGTGATLALPPAPIAVAAVLTERLEVEWPRRLFQPRALACSDAGDVFVADEFRVYRLQDRSLDPVSCDLDGQIIDLGAYCSPDGACHPEVLVSAGSSDTTQNHVMDCERGATLPLFQTPQPAQRLAPLGQTSLLAVQAGGRVLEYTRSSTRVGWQPVGQFAFLDEDGLVAAFASARDFFALRAPSSGSAGWLESRAVSAPEKLRRVWTLPLGMPPSVGACAVNGSSALVLTSSAVGDDPQIFRLDLPP
jgi:hypothetical protein